MKIKGIVQENTKNIEQFQNEVLRPILKQQHGLLLACFQSYLTQQKIDFASLHAESKEKHIHTVLSKNTAFKNLNIGIVVGQFSEEEFNKYTKDSGEYNRRILQMLKKRLKDTLIA